MTFEQWADYGLNAGWCGPVVCSTHDGTPMSDEEADQFDDGLDPCIPIIRLYDGIRTKVAVEMDHAPSRWRKPAVGA